MTLPITLKRLILCAVLLAVTGAARGETPLTVTPQQTEFRGQATRQQLLVTEVTDGRPVDRTGQARFCSDTPGVVRVDAAGVVTPVGDGAGTVTATVGPLQAQASFQVTDARRWLPVEFERDVEPILTRAGCNAGACHGKARGQNGFQLSLLGFDRDFDHAALTKEARGRRIFPAAPDKSLLLLKPTGQVAHGGGKRLELNEPPYEMLRHWIAGGAPRGSLGGPLLAHITVEPEK